MAVEWTQEERKRYLRDKFYTHQMRLAIVAVCLLILMILLFLAGHFLSQGMYLVFFMFLMALIISGVIVIYVIDMIYFGAE